MELKPLRAFVKVAEYGTISQAALALGITQSSLSRIITALEHETGTPLFHRTGRGVALTPAGESALPRARRIVKESEELAATLRFAGQAPGGIVTVAMLPSVMRDMAGVLFEAVQRANPRITLRILEGFSGHIEEWLDDGRADIGVMSRYRKSHARHEHVIATSHLMLVGAPERGRARHTVRFHELATTPLVLPAHPNGMRIALDAIARRLRIELPVVAEADSIEAQKAIIARGACYAIFGRQTTWRELAGGDLAGRTIVEPRVPRLLVIATSKHHPPGSATREVLLHLRRIDCFAKTS